MFTLARAVVEVHPLIRAGSRAGARAGARAGKFLVALAGAVVEVQQLIRTKIHLIKRDRLQCLPSNQMKIV